jgi:hypothetical protein
MILRLPALGLIVMMGVLQAAALAAPSDIVYGNLGPNGVDPISATSTDFGGGAISDTVAKLAQGFTTGTSSQNLFVQSAILGLFSNDSPASRTIGIFLDNGGKPAASALYTSDAVNVTDTGKYTFSFGSGVWLSPSTSYWIVPQGPASWYLSDDEAGNPQPTGQNGSGWQYLGTRRMTTVSGTWSNSNLAYSVSVSAVPEPSQWTMAAGGLASLLAFSARRLWKRS